MHICSIPILKQANLIRGWVYLDSILELDKPNHLAQLLKILIKLDLIAFQWAAVREKVFFLFNSHIQRDLRGLLVIYFLNECVVRVSGISSASDHLAFALLNCL